MAGKEQTYQERKPIKKLEGLVHSFWMHRNIADMPERLTIVPDSYFKVIFLVQRGKVVNYFMTGLWLWAKDFTIPPETTVYGCRLKILAPEFLIGQEVASILQGFRQLDLTYLNLRYFDFGNFYMVIQQLQIELLKIKPSKAIAGNKIRLSQLLDETKGDITVRQLSEQVYWSERQINRYMNKHLGVSLKKYLNLQKVYQSYIQIREGHFFPKKYYFDQAHFIREVKKHTGEVPSKLYELQNGQFIQLKNIQKK